MDNSETGGTGVKFLEMETSRATYDAGRTNAKVPFSVQVQSLSSLDIVWCKTPDQMFKSHLLTSR